MDIYDIYMFSFCNKKDELKILLKNASETQINNALYSAIRGQGDLEMIKWLINEKKATNIAQSFKYLQKNNKKRDIIKFLKKIQKQNTTYYKK